MWLPGPRVDDGQAGSVKWRRVARGYRETIRRRDGRDIAICRRNGLPTRTSAGAQRCVGLRCRVVKGQYATCEQWQDAPLKTEKKRVPAFALWQYSDTEAQLGKADCREVECFDHLRVDPGKYVRVACRFQRLRNDVGIEQDHSKLIGSAGVLSRSISRSTPPASRPISASREPSLIRPSGRTAHSRIARISASVLRPCVAARTRKARCVSSGKLRTVTDAIAITH